MLAKQSDQQPIDNTDSEGGETDVAVVAKEPSPLDRALMSTRHSRPDATSLWMQGDSVVAVVPMAFMPGNITAAPSYSEEHATAVEPAVQALGALEQATRAVLDVRAASQSDPTLTEAATKEQAGQQLAVLLGVDAGRAPVGDMDFEVHPIPTMAGADSSMKLVERDISIDIELHFPMEHVLNRVPFEKFYEEARRERKG